MPAPRKRPCSICHHWFRPNPRVGSRQRVCSRPECQSARRKKTQANWRAKNPEYAAGYRIQQRSAQEQPPEPLRLPAPLGQLPWDLAKDQFGQKGTDFIGVMGSLLVRSAKDQFRAYLVDPTRFSSPLPLPLEKTRSRLPHTETRRRTASHYATGVSPTRSALGASASPPSATAATAVGLRWPPLASASGFSS
jgi:hypothetical protein